MTTTEMLATYNALRARLNKSHVKEWKASKLALEQAIAKCERELEAKPETFPMPEAELEAQTIRPKAEPELPQVVEVIALPPKPAKKTKQAKQDKQASAVNEVVAFCKKHGINDKVARAKLRKAQVAKVNGHYPLTKRVQELLLSIKRKQA